MINCVQIYEKLNEILPIEKLEKVDVHGNEKFTIQRHVHTLLYAHLSESSSLREIGSKLKGDIEIQKYTGVISYSQLSRVNSSREADVFKSVFDEVYAKVVRSNGLVKIPLEYGKLKALDSTAISLCLKLFPWAVYRKNVGGVKIHTLYDALHGCPESIVLTDALTHDKTKMSDFITEPGITYLFDRAYLDYNEYDRYCSDGIYFVTRLKKNALIEVLSERAVPNGGNVLSDKTVILGGGTAKMTNPLRLIEVVDSSNGEIFHIVTNRFDLSAEDIADIYRLRWSIEVFFKWIKQHLKIKHFYGRTFNAVLIQIYCALILYCLLKIIHVQYCKKFNFLEMVRLIAACPWNTLDYLIQCLTPTRRTTSKRTKYADSLQGYKEILIEYELFDCFI